MTTPLDMLEGPHSCPFIAKEKKGKNKGKYSCGLLIPDTPLDKIPFAEHDCTLDQMKSCRLIWAMIFNKVRSLHNYL